MSDKNTEIYIVVIIGAILFIFLVGFIVTMLFLYQRRQYRQEKELVRLKDLYAQEALRSQLEIQEDTFKMIGQELHDNIGQALSVVKLSLAILPIGKTHEAYESILNSRQILNQAMLDLADLTKNLHTDRIGQIGLEEAIRFQIESVRKGGLLQIDFNVEGHGEIEQQKAIVLFRIFQEMLNNILKHAKASAASVTLHYPAPEEFLMIIKDNGVGFNVEEKKNSVSSSSGVGLKSIFNRAKLIGAGMDLESEPGKGTTVTIRLKLTN